MIDRRALLRLAAGAGTASLVAACGWDGGNAVRPLLLDISRFNDWMGEKIFFSKHRLAPEYPVAERTARVPVAGRGVGARAAGAVARPVARDATHQLYREASLRGGMERDRDVARRACVRGRRAVRRAAAGPVCAVRFVRLRLFQRLGSRERDASADDSRVRDERQSAAADARGAAPALFAHQARLQDDEVPGVTDVHRRAAGRVLGGSGVSVVWRNLIFGSLTPTSACHGESRMSQVNY